LELPPPPPPPDLPEFGVYPEKLDVVFFLALPVPKDLTLPTNPVVLPPAVELPFPSLDFNTQ
jgi:hypothetical protein